MSKVREVGTKEWVSCLDGDCPARSCFAPGPWPAGEKKRWKVRY